MGLAFAATLIDPAFKRRFTEVHHRLNVQPSAKSTGSLALSAPLFRDLKAAADAVVSGLWEMELHVKSSSIRVRDRADLPIRVRRSRAKIRREQREKPVRVQSKA